MTTTTTTPPSTYWCIWQMIDSNLPTGGFAHSYGLEAAVQLGQYNLAQPHTHTHTHQHDQNGGDTHQTEEAKIQGLLLFTKQALKQQAALLLPLVRRAYTAAVRAENKDLETSDVKIKRDLGGRREEEGGMAGAQHVLLNTWAKLDQQCHALITTEGGRRGSLAQGQALLRLACDAFPLVSLQQKAWLCVARERIRGRGRSRQQQQGQQQEGGAKKRRRGEEGGAKEVEEENVDKSAAAAAAAAAAAPPPPLVPVKGHQAPLFGWICHALGIDIKTTARMFLYLVLRDLMAAATRLGLVGPLLAVRLQMSLYREAEEIMMTEGSKRKRKVMEGVEEEEEEEEEEEGSRQDNPLLDILQGAHEKLYSRLFIS